MAIFELTKMVKSMDGTSSPSKNLIDSIVVRSIPSYHKISFFFSVESKLGSSLVIIIRFVHGVDISP